MPGRAGQSEDPDFKLVKRAVTIYRTKTTRVVDDGESRPFQFSLIATGSTLSRQEGSEWFEI